MEQQVVVNSPFRISDPRQLRIYEGLLRIGIGPAAAFKDACQIMESPGQFEYSSHLVAHLVREIESGIRSIIEPMAPPAITQPPRKKKGEAADGHQSRIHACLDALQIPRDDSIAIRWLDLGKREKGLAARAHRNGLNRPRPIDDEFWIGMQSIFEVVCDRFETLTTRYLTVADDLARSPAPPTAASDFQSRIPNSPLFVTYFLGRIPTASISNWFEALREAGILTEVPDTEISDDGSSRFYPEWPAANFLVRAASIPELQPSVADVIRTVEANDNPWVAATMVEIATTVTPEIGASLVDRLLAELSPGKVVILGEHFATLALRFLDSDLKDPAFKIAAGVLKLTQSQSADTLVHPARFDSFLAARFMEQMLPRLLGADIDRTFEFVCDLLQASIAIGPESAPDDPKDDASYSWRPAIEEHAQNGTEEIRDLHVGAVRRAAEKLATTEESARRVVALLEARNRDVFRRIALHVLRVCPLPPMEMVAARLTDPRLFSDFRVHHEYYWLLKERFARLRQSEQDRILTYIENGPEIESWSTHFQRAEERAPTAEEVRSRVTRWQRDRLEPIAELVPEAWKARYTAVVAEHEAAEHPDFLAYHSGVSCGQPSPKSAQEIGSMPLPALVDFMRTWKPTKGWDQPTQCDLSIEFMTAVGANPTRYADKMDSFIGTDPTYVRGAFQGLREAATNGRPFDWDKVLDLAAWAVGQRSEPTVDAGDGHQRDTTWSPARRAIASALSAGFHVGPCEIPVVHRTRIWSILVTLTNDQDPDPRAELAEPIESQDFTSRSINSARGEAMHAVIRYALWVRRSFEGDATKLANGFDEMPELREVLNEHLDPAVDGSPAIRSVYGQWYPHLMLIDQEWTLASTPKIFPSNETHALLRRAAWEGYILCAGAFRCALKPLLEQYGMAVAALGQENKSRGPRRRDTDVRLAEHLMVHYWQGSLALDAHGGLLQVFFEFADSALRKHAIDFIGRSLQSAKSEISPETLARLRLLFESRIAEASSATDSPRDPNELAAFGSWFASKKLADEWSIDTLLAVLSVGGRIEYEYQVVDRLAELAPLYPKKCVDCLRVMATEKSEFWRFRVLNAQAKTILSIALRGSDDTARVAARELVNRLVLRGQFDFKELLVEEEGRHASELM